MKALAYFGKNDVRVVDKPRPRLDHPEDAIVRVTTAAICGSDLHLYHGMISDTRIDHTFGHEIVGIVDEVGAEVTKVKPGDRVRLGNQYREAEWQGLLHRRLPAAVQSLHPARNGAESKSDPSHGTGQRPQLHRRPDGANASRRDRSIRHRHPRASARRCASRLRDFRAEAGRRDQSAFEADVGHIRGAGALGLGETDLSRMTFSGLTLDQALKFFAQRVGRRAA